LTEMGQDYKINKVRYVKNNKEDFYEKDIIFIIGFCTDSRYA